MLGCTLSPPSSLHVARTPVTRVSLHALVTHPEIINMQFSRSELLLKNTGNVLKSANMKCLTRFRSL